MLGHSAAGGQHGGRRPLRLLPQLLCALLAVGAVTADSSLAPARQSAATVEELVAALPQAPGSHVAINLTAALWYNFTSDVSRLQVLEGATATIDCQGAVLKACEDCGPFIILLSNSTLTLHNCVTDTSNLLVAPVEDRLNWTPLLYPGSSLVLQDVLAYEENCLGVRWLAANFGRPTAANTSVKTDQFGNDTFVYHVSTLATLSDMDVCLRNVTFVCVPEPEVAGDSRLAGWKLAAVIVGCVLGCAAIAAALACLFLRRRRRSQQEAKPKVIFSEPGSSRRGASDESVQVRILTASADGSRADGSRADGSRADGSRADGSRVVSSAGDAISIAVREMKEDLRPEHLQVHEMIGCGGHGTVHRGTWRGLTVAVKIMLYQGVCASDESMQIAAAEAAIAYNLNHPNIVATYSHELRPIADEEVGTLSCWRLSLVQELCTGGTLSSLIEDGLLTDGRGGMHVPRVLSVLLDIALAMAHIHSHRIAHGDLTPNNVLLQVPDGLLPPPEGDEMRLRIAQAFDSGCCRAKVTDFGLSTRLDAGTTHASNVFHGTPFYCAPEVLQQHRLQQASDVFSFGVIMWSVANSFPPYVARQGILERHPFFPYFQPAVPDAFALLALACIAVDPKVRPGFAAVVAVLTALRQSLAYEAAADSDLPKHVSPDRLLDEHEADKPPGQDLAGPGAAPDYWVTLDSYSHSCSPSASPYPGSPVARVALRQPRVHDAPAEVLRSLCDLQDFDYTRSISERSSVLLAALRSASDVGF